MGKVVGFGGVFFKAKAPHLLSSWYKDNLGVNVLDWGGAVYPWSGLDKIHKNGVNIWTPFDENTEHFAPSNSNFMFNFVVDNLVELIVDLKAKNFDISEIQTHEQGKFAWILDPEGNKVELWEPVC